MKRTGFVIVGGILLACASVAQSQTGAQAGAQAGAQTSAQAGKTQAQGSGSTSAGTSASAQNGQGNASLASGSTINAALSAPIDSKKAKQGDAVIAHTTEATKADGKTIIPKGAKLVGHVTQASARAKGDGESSLGIVFDKAILKDGQEVPLNVAIQALSTAHTSAAESYGDEMGGMHGAVGASGGGSGRAAGGTRSGVTSAPGGAVGTVANTTTNAGTAAAGTVNSTAHSTTNTTASTVGSVNAAGQLASTSRGVFGMEGVALNSATTGAAQGSIITSTGKNVHLDSGTQLLLVTQAASTAPTKP